MKKNGVAQTVLDRYRDSLSPSQRTRERVLRELTLRVSRGDTPDIQLDAAQELPLAGPITSAGVSPVLATAVVAGATVLLAFGGLWWREHERTSRLPAPRAHSAEPAALPSRAPDPIEPAAPPTGTPAHPEVEVEASQPAKTRARPSPPRPSEPRRMKSGARDDLPTRGRETAPAAKAKPTEEPQPNVARQAPPSVALPTRRTSDPDDLAAELRLIRAAYAALQANKPEAALAHVTEHSVRFPQGSLAESRDVARIMALCQAGKTTQGRAEIARFLTHSPGSAYASRVKSLCIERPTGRR